MKTTENKPVQHELLTNLLVTLLIPLFVHTALSKLLDISTFRQQMRMQSFPNWIAMLIVWTWPPLGLISAGLLAFKPTRFFRSVCFPGAHVDFYRLCGTGLSRRLETHTLRGRSFCGYLSFRHGIHFTPILLDDPLNKSMMISSELSSAFKPLAIFRQYLKEGYFPFSRQAEASSFQFLIIQIINNVLESNLAYVQDYSPSSIIKIKKLLGVIASSVPFEPNISKIA